MPKRSLSLRQLKEEALEAHCLRQIPQPCLLCREPKADTARLFVARAPARRGAPPGHTVCTAYRLCRTCAALPGEDLVLRVEAMLAANQMGHNN
ncbi:MAG TPA: hypothetical protein VI542_34635 [Candidatus Tectomicrobia bacterium]